MSLPAQCKIADEMTINEARVTREYEAKVLADRSGEALAHPCVVTTVAGGIQPAVSVMGFLKTPTGSA